MQHAILGAGGVGLLVGGGLAHAGHPVLLILRPQALDTYPGGIHVQSGLLGEFDVDVPASPRLDREVDVLWVTVKATQLGDALRVASPAVAPRAVVVPLLNGLDHLSTLREVYGDQVIPGAIRVESERVGPGHVVHVTPFVSTELAPPAPLRDRAEAIAAEMNGAGLPCAVRDDEGQVMWGKLALLAPFALGTSSVGQPIGAARQDPDVRDLMLRMIQEVCAVAASEGVQLDPDRMARSLLDVPEGMRTSMQKDLAARRPLELDAIAGTVVRRGRARGIPTPATEELVRRVGQAASL